MKAKWKDTSTYGQKDTQRIPWKWWLDLGELTLTVHRHRDHPVTTWLATCYGAFEHRKLESVDIESAKAESVQMLRKWLAVIADNLPDTPKKY